MTLSDGGGVVNAGGVHKSSLLGVTGSVFGRIDVMIVPSAFLASPVCTCMRTSTEILILCCVIFNRARWGVKY